MPQSVLTETEIRLLAATPYQIINPGSNKPIIGIFQDSLLGSFRFTRKGIQFSPRDAMNLLMSYPHVNVNELRQLGKTVTNFDILSQITPPISLKYKTGLFDEDKDDANDPENNHMLEIYNGKYLRGQTEKSVYDSASKGILHRIYNDYGPMACADYNDALQAVVTEYMKSSSFSVGISDLIADRATNEKIVEAIRLQKMEVQTIIDKVHLGIFENTTANSNNKHFELMISNILNKATEESGKIGKKSLSQDNRFLMIVNSGSKGNLVNISQMISCLGQQAVDGKRIAYGFDDRTLPHFKKYDDSPNARGFVENSYITGLTAPELFFHAMAGRTGLIDTAVKSVTRETTIVVIQDGKPLYTQIGDWIDGQLDAPENTAQIQYTPEDRNLELLPIEEGRVYIPTTDADGHVSWGDVTAVTRHDPGMRLYQVVTQSGRKVTVAESQSLLVWDPVQNQFLPKPSPEIHVGDKVPVTLHLCPPPVSEPLHIATSIHTMDTEGFVPTKAFMANHHDISAILTHYYRHHGKVLESTPGFTVGPSPYRLMEGIAMLCSRLSVCGRMWQDPNPVADTDSNTDTWYFTVDDHAHMMRLALQITLTVELETYLKEHPGTHFLETVQDMVLDPITSIHIIGTEAHPKLYDLTIPSTLNFGLANGLQVRDTASTGYIQRRLVKGLEDLMVNYDMTVRNNKGKIIQFAYGDDHFDSTKIENQILPVANLSVEDIYMHYDIPGMVEAENTLRLAIFTKEAISRMNKQKEKCRDKCYEYATRLIRDRDLIVDKVFNRQSEVSVRIPVGFQYIIQNIQGQLDLRGNSAVDITPYEAFELIEEYFEKINSIPFAKTNSLFRVIYFYYLTPRDLLIKRRFHRKALILLLETVLLRFKEALVHPGEMVGVLAAQEVGEPCTQLTLNSVIWEEKITIRNRDGQIRVLPIGEFTEEQVARSKKIQYMADKDTTYAELDPEEEYYEVPGANEAGDTVWRRIEAVTQHPVVNEDGTNTMLRVTTQGGRVVTATKAKSFLHLIDGKILPVEGKDLKVGDYLPVSVKPLEFKESHTLDLREVLPPTEFIYGTEFTKAVGVMGEYRWWLKHANKTFTLPFHRSDSIVAAYRRIQTDATCVNYEPGLVYTKTNNIANYRIPEMMDLDYDFGYTMGAYCAEGCTTSHQISIANNDPAFFAPIIRLCERYNLTYKMYTHNNKIQEGWTSSDMRIYSTLLTHILTKLGGKLSHLKYVSPKIVFSNRDCMLGFLDAYIGGDGCIQKDANKVPHAITIASTSKPMLIDVMVMLRNLGIKASIGKPCQITHNNRGTAPEKIQPIYTMYIGVEASRKLAPMLNVLIEHKQVALRQIIQRKIRPLTEPFPNLVNGVVSMEPRNGRMPDLIFVPIISIEEVPNTRDHVYDLTVEDTRNFDLYHGLTQNDTFHSSGVASKSNVTRGVPRIEEILRLTKNPKNPSMTVYLKPIDETDQDKAIQYATRMTHTRLIDVVQSVQVCFDPHPNNTQIPEDQLLLEQFFEFENMIEDCLEAGASPDTPRSKWIIRMEMDQEALIDKNITMDDIHFAIANSEYGKDVQCIFSDHNMDKLVFRIRTNSSVFDKSTKKTRGLANPLDQSDEIYILKNFQDTLLHHIVLRGVNGVQNILPRKIQNSMVKENDKYVKKETWVLDTTGSNLLETLALPYIDNRRTISTDIKEVAHVLGIEAARQCIHNEMVEVLGFSGASVNYHHLSVLCDRMTCNKGMVSIYRSGLLNDNVGPIAKATFEVHTEVFLSATRHAEMDHMRGVSANIMCGQYGAYGTNSCQVLLDMKAFEHIKSAPYKRRNVKEEIERGMAQAVDTPADCTQIEIQNNIVNIRHTNDQTTTCYDDGYNLGF